MFSAFLFATLFTDSSDAECINACGGHGQCGQREMCDCQKGWMGADCTQRICPFGFAYVDTPKGDLNADGVMEPYYNSVGYMSHMYPYGTTEEWPHMQDSDGALLQNTAHWYMECSNSGYCNRNTGDCECLAGFHGHACQRMHCPGWPDHECSGKGQCLPVGKIAKSDYGNSYDLWDKNIFYGCLCDPGFYGAACEEQHCKKGLDPFYVDDVQTARYPVMHLAIMTTSDTLDFNDGFAQPQEGRLKVRVFTPWGEPMLTKPLVAGQIDCPTLVQALEEIPNHIVPEGGTVCTRTRVTFSNPLATADISDFTFNYQSRYTFVSDGNPKGMSFRYKPTFWDAGFRNSYDSDDTVLGNVTGDIFRLEFFKNVGNMRPLEVETFLGDGINRPSTVSAAGRTIFRSWTDGQQGEDVDYFANLCRGVTVRIATGTHGITGLPVYYLTNFDASEKALLKACLGGSDFDLNNDVDIYNWDHGSAEYPHMVRMIRSVTDEKDGGYYVTLIYDTTITMDNLGTEGTFTLLQPFEGDYNSNRGLTDWLVYTTNGVLQMTSDKTQATYDFASNILFTSNTTVPAYGDYWHGDMSCEINAGNDAKLQYLTTCLNKGDIIVLLDPTDVRHNPQYINMYTIKRLHTQGTSDRIHPEAIDRYFYPVDNPKAAYLYSADHYNVHMITTDLTTNWATTITGAAQMRIYKFFPADNSTYKMVTECSNRGICNTYDGICDCFNGYVGEACSEQWGSNYV